MSPDVKRDLAFAGVVVGSLLAAGVSLAVFALGWLGGAG